MADRSERKGSAGWGRPFQKGKSGNPKGRPRRNGSPVPLAPQTILQTKTEELLEKVIEMALGGDRACLRLCIDRLIPAKKDSPLKPGLPPIAAAADLPRFFAAVAARLEQGEIAASEAKALKELAEFYRKLIEMVELEPRVSELEEMLNSPKQ